MTKGDLRSAVRGQAFVTGGASGIGEALCRRLARAGVRVCIADIDSGAATALAEELGAKGGEACALGLDVSDRDAFREAVARVERDGGDIDLLINNAGVGVGGEVRDHTPEDWQRVMSINLFGVVHGVDACYGSMVARGRGTIVNVASLAGLVPVPGEATYVASKFAVVGMTKVLAAEAEALGINVCLVCPGVVRTPIYDSSPVRGFDSDKVLSMWPSGVTADQCAKRILRAISRGERTVVVTRTAKALWLIERVSPSLMARFGRLYMKQMRRHRVA